MNATPEFFTRILDDRHHRPKTYTQRKLQRLCKHFSGKVELIRESCVLRARVMQAGRRQEYVFYLR